MTYDLNTWCEISGTVKLEAVSESDSTYGVLRF